MENIKHLKETVDELTKLINGLDKITVASDLDSVERRVIDMLRVIQAEAGMVSRDVYTAISKRRLEIRQGIVKTEPVVEKPKKTTRKKKTTKKEA